MVGEGDGQFWGGGRGAIAGCHCSVLWLGGRASFFMACIDGFIDGFLLVNSPFPVPTVVNVLQRHFWFTVQTLVMTNVMQAWIVRR